MPSTEQRKNSASAKQRRDEKYILVDEERHPHKLWPPIKKDTEEFRQLMNGKNYVRVMTQLGLNQYIVLQYYIYCEDDIWACGDAFVLNANPDKKILCQCMCVKTRKVCCAYEESSHEFIMICPNPECHKPSIGLKNTHWKCKHCDLQIKYDQINDAPFVKIPCEMCPVEIGWDKAEEKAMADFYKEHLQIRGHLVGEQVESMMKEMEANDE